MPAEIYLVPLTLWLFTAFGLPVAAVLRSRAAGVLLCVPGFGMALLAVGGTLLYVAGIPLLSISVAAVMGSIVSAAVFRRLLWQMLAEACRHPVSTLLTGGFAAVLLAPIYAGGTQFTVFQGNQFDDLSYVTAAAAYSKLPFAAVTSATTDDFLQNPLLVLAQKLLYRRPTTSILFALVARLPGTVATGGYAFLASLMITGMLAFKGLLCRLSEKSSPIAATLLAAAYACGFWGQYSTDIDAWSAVASMPVLLSFWMLAMPLVAEEDESERARLIGVLGLLAGTGLYLYPEATVFHSLMLAGLVGATEAWRLLKRRAWRQASGPAPGRAALPVAAAMVSGFALALLFQRGTLGFAEHQIGGAARLAVGWWTGFDAYLFGTDPALNQSLIAMASAALQPDRGHSLILPTDPAGLALGTSGVFGLYFLTPRHWGALDWLDWVKSAVLVVVLVSAGAALATGLLGRRNSPRLAVGAAFLGLFGAMLVLQAGLAWAAGKGLSYAAPMLCLAITAPGVGSGWRRLLPVPWALAQGGFAVLALIGLSHANGVRLGEPYPDWGTRNLKAEHRWDIAANIARLGACPLVQIVAVEPIFRQYAAIALFMHDLRFFYTEPVMTYFGSGESLGHMPAGEASPQCHLVESAAAMPVGPGLPPSGVASFPAGLMVPNLFFSGVTQDGWLGARAETRLALAGSSRLHLVGEVPDFSARILGGTMTVTVDGTVVLERREAPGAFDLVMPIPRDSGVRSIRLDVTGTDTLPGEGRTVSIRLKSITLEERTLEDPE
jgi:hypothetical protein